MLLLLATVIPGFDPEVQAHLLDVVHTLREETPSVDEVRLSRRMEMLDLLENYAVAGEFPERLRRGHDRSLLAPRMFQGSGERSPVFVDHDGTHCAVGYLIAADDPELALDIDTRFHDAWLPDMEDPRLGPWADRHGFTVDELAWIQPGYSMRMLDCSTFSPLLDALPEGTTGSCSGIDLAVLPMTWGSAHACLQGCGPTVEVWLPVHNVGDTLAERGQIVARLGGDIVATAPMPPVTAGEIRWVGPLPLTEETIWSTVSVEATGDCDAENNTQSLGDAFALLQMNGGGRLKLDADNDGAWSAECGGTDCDDADPSSQFPACADTFDWNPAVCDAGCDDDPPTEDSSTCGCRQGGAGAWPLLALLAFRRRRLRRP